ncbi:MAG: cobalamin-dependent protein [Treponemataceae bacterium]
MAQSLFDLRSLLYNCVLDADRAGAARLLDQAVREYGFNPVIADALEPTLRRIGERFAKDKISLAQGYVAGKIAEDLLGKFDATNDQTIRPQRGTIVLGNAEDDYHALGRKMVSAFLRVEGWHVEDLGNDVLPELFVDTAERVGARVIGVSAMMLTNALNITKIREELDKRGLRDRIKLAVGGAVFVMRPELVAEVGGDGTATTAMDAPALFDSLDTQAGGGE